MIGPGRCDDRTAALAEEVGAGLASAGFTLVTGALGDLIGWVETETDGITGSLKLFIK